MMLWWQQENNTKIKWYQHHDFLKCTERQTGLPRSFPFTLINNMLSPENNFESVSHPQRSSHYTRIYKFDHTGWMVLQHLWKWAPHCLDIYTEPPSVGKVYGIKSMGTHLTIPPLDYLQIEMSHTPHYDFLAHLPVCEILQKKMYIKITNIFVHNQYHFFFQYRPTLPRPPFFYNHSRL